MRQSDSLFFIAYKESIVKNTLTVKSVQMIRLCYADVV